MDPGALFSPKGKKLKGRGKGKWYVVGGDGRVVGRGTLYNMNLLMFFSPVASAPLNVVVNIVSTTWFFVTWSPPAMVGDGITGYYVHVDGNRYPTSTTTYNASNLTSGRSYNLQVSGINSFGEGDRSSSSSVQLMTLVTGE